MWHSLHKCHVAQGTHAAGVQDPLPPPWRQAWLLLPIPSLTTYWIATVVPRETILECSWSWNYVLTENRIETRIIPVFPNPVANFNSTGSYWPEPLDLKRRTEQNMFVLFEDLFPKSAGELITTGGDQSAAGSEHVGPGRAWRPAVICHAAVQTVRDSGPQQTVRGRWPGRQTWAAHPVFCGSTFVPVSFFICHPKAPSASRQIFSTE